MKDQNKNNNPSGKGGFGDNPQKRATGRWDKTESISYQYNMLMRLKASKMKVWLKENPEDVRTVAQDLAYNAVVKARKDLAYLREVTDRVEGKAMQYSEIRANVKTFEGLSEETMEKLDSMYVKNNQTDKG